MTITHRCPTCDMPYPIGSPEWQEWWDSTPREQLEKFACWNGSLKPPATSDPKIDQKDQKIPLE